MKQSGNENKEIHQSKTINYFTGFILVFNSDQLQDWTLAKWNFASRLKFLTPKFCKRRPENLINSSGQSTSRRGSYCAAKMTLNFITKF